MPKTEKNTTSTVNTGNMLTSMKKPSNSKGNINMPEPEAAVLFRRLAKMIFPILSSMSGGGFPKGGFSGGKNVPASGGQGFSMPEIYKLNFYSDVIKRQKTQPFTM